MSDNLVKRLREEESVWKNFGDVRIPNFLAEAAYRIEQLESEEEDWNRICNSYAARVDELEAALRKISQEQTLWGAMRKAQHALGEFDRKALEGKDD